MKALLFAFVILLSSCHRPHDMQKYLSDTQAFIRSKNYSEALNRCIWFHEHSLEYDPAMTGVRLSFALSYWKRLADAYPPAMDSLMAMRDRKTQQLINSPATKLFSEVDALNRVLKDGKKTIAVFETLSKSHPEDAVSYWMYVKDDLFTSKRYDLISKYIGNPLDEFSVSKERFYQNIASSKKLKPNAEYFKIYAKNNFVKKSLQLIEFSLEENDKRSALEIQRQAMEIVEDYRLRDAVAIDK